ncbi:MAG: hypothetical protein A3I61_05080 [Acidobacteria bacterium RIFCSPLOWO2_02_FULL_68_18]|nr:MAG: hypothetical protein A3I61_05080 [Acidobacteria bacterium RIFCSPLOWO2_02_FULL_68_18]OFW51279.1 MAG: hypothetical protein A3G77_05485 [Acidobacteria bacterium RIFCSPLOWO2_12_FULL_68_19]
MTQARIKVLVLEDSAADAELMVRELGRAGLAFDWARVDTRAAFAAALDPAPDLVLADYRLPDFNGLRALELVLRRGLDVPLIVVTGEIGEELAAECVRRGATDYLLKDRLERLGPAVVRALEEARVRREHRRSEDELRAMHVRMRHLLAHGPAILYGFDLRGDTLTPLVMTENVKTAFGFSLEEANSAEWWLAQLHPEDRDRMLAARAALLQGKDFTGEYRIRHKDGAYRWIEDHVRVLRNPAGEPSEAIGVWIDVTERKHVATALLANEARLRVAMKASNIGPWERDLTTNEVYYSPEWKRQIGYRDDEIAGRYEEWESRLHPDDRERTVRALRAYLADPARGYDVEFRLRHKDGSYRWIQTRGMLTFDDGGRPVRITGCHVDLTERKALELERARLARTLQLLLDSTGEGIYGVDPEGRCTFVNKAGAAALGWRPEEVVGRPMHPLVHHSRPDGSPFPVEKCPILDAPRTGQSRHADDDVFWRRDGSSFPVEYSSSPIRDEDEIRGAVVIFRDVTEERTRAAQLQQAQKMEAIGRLAGGIAHDFNNLLTVILGCADLMNDDVPAGSAAHRELDEIREAAGRARNLTSQLLAFSRRQILQPRVVDANEVVAGITGMIERLLGEDVALHTTLEPRLHPIVVDPGQLEQVLVNLCVNARDAMPEGGTLTIESRNVRLETSEHGGTMSPGDYSVLVVTDTGKGMDQETQARIFEPFFTTKQGGGTGLGLATVYGIVKQSNGFIWVYSEPGHGTTFRICFPRAGGAAAAPVDEAPRRRRQAPLDGTTVLLVEDSEPVRRLARRFLHGAGCVVIEAGSPAEALTVAGARGDIDLLVTDVVMPGGSGPKLYAQMKGAMPRLKVLYTSGYTEDAMIRHGISAGETAFLEKPFTREALLAKVAEVVAGGGS